MYCQYSASRMYGPRFRSAKNDLTRGKTLHPVTFRKIIFIPFCQNFIKHPKRPYIRGRYKQDALYRVVQKKGTVLLSTSLAWPAVAGCSRAETLSQLSSNKFTPLCSGALGGHGIWNTKLKTPDDTWQSNACEEQLKYV